MNQLDVRGLLKLEDGTVFEGYLFGSKDGTDGEVVFNTGMVGYVEALTDPSYRGQILTFTYPLIGNYGIPGEERYESKGIQVRGAVLSKRVDSHSHWESISSIDEWFSNNGIPGICGIDTRALTKHLRSKGTMLGRITRENDQNVEKIEDPNSLNLVSEVTRGEMEKVEGEGPRILLLDCGAKRSIERSLKMRGCSLICVPYDHPLSGLEYDGIMISNGPGDPERCEATIENVKELIDSGDPPPIGGICLGNQILALASGAKTYKLKFGHRSQNQPCRESGTENCLVTSQNHGYAVDEKSLPEGWDVWYRNLNDRTVEGIRHKTLPLMAVQFHPEANPGPTDPDGFFDSFLEVVKNGQ